MSVNQYEIVAVTAAFWYILELDGDPKLKVTLKSPDGKEDGNTSRNWVNVFLYRVSENPGYYGSDLPTRNDRRELVHRPELWLDLHYLVTAYGEKDDDMQAQIAMAIAARKLHERQLLLRQDLETILTTSEVKAKFPGIDQFVLPDQVRHTTITRENLSLEDLTKLWSSFFKTSPYHLSAGYKATTVLLQGRTGEQRTPSPVRDRNVYVIAARSPEIAYIQPQIVEYAANGMEVDIIGQNLRADDVRLDYGRGVTKQEEETLNREKLEDLRFDRMEKLDLDLVRGERITLQIPNPSQSPIFSTAGVKKLKVVHPLNLGTPRKPHRGPESNTAVFAVAPKITVAKLDAPNNQRLVVEFEPPAKKEQKVTVILGSLAPIEVKLNNDASKVEVDLPPAIKKGTYPVRLQIDRAESQPGTDPPNNSEYGRPTVDIT
ncbi:Protein of unknown function (DUF4255) [Candidatus Nitrososphaera evergladensis SR1]|uniref:Pvc16 N-terminal domain-containing protein n=1 Tax=Candidatus Nitrososphaera evergladensis SR1 TaxID=1459636 RepID=A0A075MN53_9ARCH|nr:DUF4255 domain-containing protein [Candidatus Nitrososphaera evergladensis]AIF82580.1 Protein of unknown function (DUF4255) [Candidatus Nitrososphaera evergladensis SR1]